MDNEPDLKNAPIGGERDPTFCTVEQYAQVLRLTAQAIRGADSGARVLNGGIYRPHRPEGKQYLSELIEQAGSSIDILSVHSYPEDLDTFLRGVDTALEHADQRPVWITETSVSSKGGEDWQAEMLEAMVTAALDRGVERIFWHTLNDPPERAKRPVGMSSHSLYHHGMVPKEAARVWQRLAMGAL